MDKLTHVINFELPEVPETYIHRIGRTGRAGETGTALSFCSSEEKPYLKDINKLLKQNIEIAETPDLPASKAPIDERKPNQHSSFSSSNRKSVSQHSDRKQGNRNFKRKSY